MDCVYRVHSLTMKHLLVLKILPCFLSEKRGGHGFSSALGSDAEPLGRDQALRQNCTNGKL